MALLEDLQGKFLRQLAYHANYWGVLCGAGVTSIAELQYHTFGDMRRAFRDIARAGYHGVELFDGNLFDYTVADMRSLLESHGLVLVTAYAGANFIFDDILPEELARMTRAMDRAAELDALHFVVGGGAKRFSGICEDDYQKLGDALERAKDLAEARGLHAHYHPHLTTLVEEPAEVERIFSLTSIDFCPDTAHLAAAGGDPPALIRYYSSRIRYVHLKSYQKSPFAFTPLDRGDVATDTVLAALREGGFDGWICTELDHWTDPFDGAKISMAYLQSALIDGDIMC